MHFRTIAAITCLLIISGCAQLQGQVDVAPQEKRHSSDPAEAARSPETTETQHAATEVDPVTEQPETDLWRRMRQGMTLVDQYDNARIDKHIEWYSKNQSYINRVSTRGKPFLHHIISELEANNMPLELALLPVVESAFDPFAYSHSHASGMWQFIPSTGDRFGLERNWWYDGRRDITESTRAAIEYLSYLNGLFDGDWLLALAAYNSGEGNVRKAIRRNKRLGKPTDFWSLKLPRETQAYVPQLLAIAKVIAEPEKHGITLLDLPNEAYFGMVEMESQVDIARASEIAGIDSESVSRLNPGYNRRVTSPNGPHRLLLPIATIDTFKTTLANTPREQWSPIKQYVVRSGDSLSRIASKYHVTISQLKQQNGLKKDFLRVGQRIKIPGTGIDSPLAGSMDIYTVRPGDSLWLIANRQNLRVRDIAKWNSLNVRTPLQVGQQLKIRGSGAAAKTKKLSYRVRSGDSLYRIANRFKLSVADILQWNKINPSAYLKLGQRLTLFIDIRQI